MPHLDLIHVRGLRLRCTIGVSAEERRDLSDVVIDLEIGTDAARAAATDSIDDAWNYRTAVKAVIAHVRDSSYLTVEALAEAIARICVVEHHAPLARITVDKPGAVRFAASAGIRVERTTADYAAPHATSRELAVTAHV